MEPLRLARAVGAAVVGAALLVGCGMQGGRPTQARLQIVAEPETARVYVDEEYVATARVLEARPRELPPGVHFVTLQAPGFFPHDLELDLPPGTTTVRVRLRPVPP